MRPFSRGINYGNREKVFNYRLSRARRIIECAFGTLTKKWRVLESPLAWKVEHSETIVMALICMHNFIITNELEMNPNQRQYLDDDEDETDNDENNIDNDYEINENGATGTRNILADYFVSPAGQVPWQWRYAFG